LWNARQIQTSYAQTRLAPSEAPGFDPAQIGSLPAALGFSVTFITDPLFYLLAIPAVIALGLSKGGFAGVGQMATPLLALVMPPLEAAAIFLPIMLIQDANALWVYRKEWSGRILAIMLPGSLIGVAIAGFLAAYISDAAVRAFIGFITIAFVLYSWFGAARLAREAKQASVPAGVFWGAFSGFTSTICQAGGPPYQMYVFSQHLPKMIYVGTTAIFVATTNGMKMAPYVALGQFSAKGLGTSLVLLPLALAANQLGFWLVRITPQERFYRIMLIIMFVLAVALLYFGAGDIMRG
jgi:uncharacterized membrane protein YfcA